MSEDLQEQIENAPSHDDNTDSSTVTEANATNETGAEASATEKTEQVKKANPVQERINQLTREKYEARQETAALEQRIKDLETRKVEEVKPKVVAPKEDDFNDYNEYQVANSEHIANSAADAAYERLSAENKVRDENSQKSARITELKSKKATFDQNLDTKRGNFQDFEEVAYGHRFMNESIASRIFGMEKGPEVAYHLGSHLDIAEKIFSLPEIDQAVELAKIEMQVEALKPKVVSDAPGAITPIQGSETVQKDPNDMNDDEWRKWRYAQLNARLKPQG